MSGRVLATEEDKASMTKQARQRSNNTTALAMEFLLDLSGFSITKPRTKFSYVARGMFGKAQMTQVLAISCVC